MTTLSSKNSINRLPFRSGLLLITLFLACFALSQTPDAFGVTPAPDGGYANGNTAEGQNALFSLFIGVYNTANGYAALYHNNTGNANTATGFEALYGNTTGIRNTADGYGALHSNTGGIHNTATGFDALYYNATGYYNTANGYEALYRNTTGFSNTATGNQALFYNTGGAGNTANGDGALSHNAYGDSNTANGADALSSNTSGYDNTANGAGALYHNTIGIQNTADGAGALYHNTTGSRNIALGVSAGSNVTTANNVICIGTDGNNVDNACYIGRIFGATSSEGAFVFINSNGRLGTSTSSRRFKEEIKPMDKASEALFALKPVAFRYKKDIDPAGTPQLGLVAEDVEKVNPDLVVRDKEGKPYSVRYEQVNAMLLNEFLKEHKAFLEEQQKVQQLEAKVTKQQKNSEASDAKQRDQIQALAARLDGQAGQIQRVSAQIEVSNFATGRIRGGGPAPQTVSSDQ